MPDDRLPQHTLGAGAVILLAIATYITSLSNGFALDDVHIIQNNPLVHSLDLRAIWTAPYWPSLEQLGLYRPLTTTLFALQWAVGGGNPAIFHVVSVALHAGASLLAFMLLVTLWGGGQYNAVAAFFGAALFAVHPVHVEAVANVVGQSELLGAIAVLGACVVHARRGPNVQIGAGRLSALVLLYAMGLATKEHTIVLPALLVAIDVAQGRVKPRLPDIRAYTRSVLLPFGSLLAVAVLFLAARDGVLGSVMGSNPNPDLGYLQGDLRIWNALRAWPEFYRLLLLPLDLSVDYSPDVIPVVRGVGILPVLGLMLLLLTVARATRVAKSMAGLAALWLLITILPVSNLLFPVGVLVAERTLYLPSFAVSIATTAASAVLLTPQGISRRLTCAAAAIVLAVFVMRSLIRNPIWESTNTVQTSLVRDHPESFRAQWVLAAAARNAGDRQRAAHHFLLADRIYGASPLFLLEYATFQLQGGNLHAGLALLQRVRRFDPDQVPARVTSAYVFNRTGQPDSALVLLRRLEREGSIRGDVDLELARALDGVGDHAAAAAAWRAGARQAGARGWVYNARSARSAARAGDLELARSALDDAMANAPDDERASTVLEALGDLIESGCFEAESCEGDPLEVGIDSSAEGDR